MSYPFRSIPEGFPMRYSTCFPRRAESPLLEPNATSSGQTNN